MINTPITKIFQERLEDLYNEHKKKHNLTYTELSSATGISRASLTKYMNDNGEIGINHLVKLANYFNVSTDYLLGLSPNPTNDKDKDFVATYTGLSIEAVDSLHTFIAAEKGIFKFYIHPFSKQISKHVEYLSEADLKESADFLSYLLNDKTNKDFAFLNYVIEYKNTLRELSKKLNDKIDFESVTFELSAELFGVDIAEGIFNSDDIEDLYKKAKYAYFDCIESYKDVIKDYLGEDLECIDKCERKISEIIKLIKQNGGDSECPQ